MNRRSRRSRLMAFTLLHLRSDVGFRCRSDQDLKSRKVRQRSSQVLRFGFGGHTAVAVDAAVVTTLTSVVPDACLIPSSVPRLRPTR